MSLLNPNSLSVQDICTAALKECGAFGVGQTPLSEDITDAWARLQFMLQEWERKRWLVYHLVTLSIVSTGAVSYTVGPAGNISTGTSANSVRPAKLESAFLRQLTQGSPNNIDFPLEILQAKEDYDRIRLKQLTSFPAVVYYDPGWPLGTLYPWPLPSANIYSLHITVLEQLPTKFTAIANTFTLPFEYYSGMLYNLALRLRPKYGIGSYPGDHLPGLAKNSLNVIRGANAQIARLTMPPGLRGNGNYNIFSDSGT